LKRNILWILLPIIFFIHPICVQALEEAPSPKSETGGQEPSALTLDDVILLALDANRSLISSAYGVDGQELSLKATRSEFDIKLFPQASASATEEDRRVGGGVSVQKKFSMGPIASVGPEVFRNYDSEQSKAYGSQLGISLTIPLLRGFGSEVNLDSIRSAEYSLRLAKRTHYLVKVNTVLEAVTATYNIVQQRELVNFFRAQSERFRGHAVMAEAKEKIGLATPIDVYRAQIRLKDSQTSLNRAQEALRNAGDRLKIVLATPLERALRVEAPLLIQPVDVDALQAVETALAHRVELKQADDDIEEAKRAARLAKNDLFPNLELVSTYTRLGNDDALNEATEFSEELWSVRLTSTTDWARSKEKAGYQQSLLTIKQRRLNRLTRMDSIKREVRQFYDALEKARERIQIRNDQIDQAKGKLALANIKFSHGMANNFDLIEAETELQEARTNLLAAQIDYIVGIYRLRGAMGTLIE
jgi:outer membrane protein TolC